MGIIAMTDQTTTTPGSRAGLARSVRRDFVDLVAIFDLQLSSPPEIDGQERFHISKAKAAAERGLRLSQELIEAMTR